MEKYIEGNKEAWEEAFDNRDASWGTDITERIQKEDYPFFESVIHPYNKFILYADKKLHWFDVEKF